MQARAVPALLGRRRQGLDLRAADLPLPIGSQIVSEHPPVLCYSVAGRLRPWLASLAGLGVSQAQVVVLVERRPTVLGIEESQLLRIVGWLRESGKDIPEIADLLGSSI